MNRPHHGDQFLLAYLKGPYQDLVFFLYNNNDMSDCLKSNVELVADDTFTFSITKNKNDSAKDLTMTSH